MPGSHREVPSPGPNEHARQDEAESRSGPHLPRPGVLVADDQEQLRTLLQIGLAQHGFAVWPAANGQEALELYKQRRRDITVALLDVRMPGLDGLQTLQALHAIHPELPCCFMTGDSGRYSQEDLHRAGAAHVFRKPFALSEVVNVLQRLAQVTPAS